MDPEPIRAQHSWEKVPRAQLFWLSGVWGEQMGSREAAPLPQLQGCSEWRVVLSKGGGTEAL